MKPCSPLTDGGLRCSRFTNIQLINTIGVAEADLNACIVSAHFMSQRTDIKYPAM
jgi:hypothetical protein